LDTYVEAQTSLSDFEVNNSVEIYRAIMRIRQKLYATSTAVAKQFDLHSSEMALLDTLGKYGPLTMGQLAELSFSSAANATYSIQGLEKLDLVTRKRSTDSHRTVNVELTAKGKKMFKKTYVQTVSAVNSILEQSLNKDQRKTFQELLATITATDSE
jgi:DNA-binding MarR family transcriptional regulator